MFNISTSECIWYKVNNYEHGKEFTNFLDTVIRAECFLQVRFHFLLKFIWIAIENLFFSAQHLL